MSTPQWQNLPVPPNSGQGWSGFSADPREAQYQHLRASDADRGNAASMLAQAHADGRLDQDEYDQRLNQAMSAKSLGELVPVLDDLAVQPPQAQPNDQACMPGMLSAKQARGTIGPFPRWWLSLAVIVNLVWLMSVIGTGHLIYYWPVWPMLGTAIPVVLGWINGGGRRQPPDERPALPPGQNNDLR